MEVALVEGIEVGINLGAVIHHILECSVGNIFKYGLLLIDFFVLRKTDRM